MDEDVRELFAGAKLLYSLENFVLVGLPGVANISMGGEGFSAVIKEKGQTTLVLPADKFLEVAGSLREPRVEGPFVAMTLDAPVDWKATGGIPELSRLLAAEGIRFTFVPAFARIHVLVRTEDAEKAINLIGTLIEDCKADMGAAKKGARQ